MQRFMHLAQTQDGMSVVIVEHHMFPQVPYHSLPSLHENEE